MTDRKSGIEGLAPSFEERFSKTPRLFSAPGRVNLIGEHTDYNAGLVLPIAIQQRTHVAAAARGDRVIRVHSRNFGEQFEFSLDASWKKHGGWLDYVEGMARTLVARGVPIIGADLAVASDVPPGSGLSSSAALELAVGLALVSLAGVDLPPRELALAGQAAEHDYVGVQCGLMDQLVGALGKASHALLIDCRSLEVTEVEIPPFAARIVVCDSRVRHAHAASGYNQRRAECQEAVRLLKKGGMQIDTLRDVGIERLPGVQALLPAPLGKRVRHVVGENARTRGAVDALRHSHLPGLGRLMTGSHVSLRDDFEVSCPELDHLVDTARRQKAVLGARMTGGGFGGSAIFLVKTPHVDEVCEIVSTSFRERFGSEPALHVTQAAGAMRAHS
ncbi:MAG: galactokinase [Polyangiaceae bacterium]